MQFCCSPFCFFADDRSSKFYDRIMTVAFKDHIKTDPIMCKNASTYTPLLSLPGFCGIRLIYGCNK